MARLGNNRDGDGNHVNSVVVHPKLVDFEKNMKFCALASFVIKCYVTWKVLLDELFGFFCPEIKGHSFPFK